MKPLTVSSCAVLILEAVISSTFFLSLVLNFSITLPDPYHAYRNLETNSLHDSNNINQNFASQQPTVASQPYFDFSVARNITTRVGQTAFLNCRVEQLGDKLVSFYFSPRRSASIHLQISIALWALWYFSIWSVIIYWMLWARGRRE